MEEFKIPTELINMCKTCVWKTRSVVRIEGTLSTFFENKTGLKQGVPLSPILFNVVLQKVIHSFIHSFHIPLILYRCGTSHVYI